MPDPRNSLYFVAVLLPTSLGEKVNDFKLRIKEGYQSKAALHAPPHITLHMPFEWKEEKEEKLITGLNHFCSPHKPFDLELRNFGAFPPRVIFINVVESPELTTLQRDLHHFFKTRLDIFNAQYRDQPFHPHVTIAFRDLKKSKFDQAWQEFRVQLFSSSFSCKSIFLLKHHSGGWSPLHEFDFSGLTAC